MKQYYQHLYNRIWKPVLKVVHKMRKGNDDDDPPFNHPWAIL